MSKGKEINLKNIKILMDQLLNGLASLRTMAGVSQEDLAGFVGVSRQTYSAVERGRKHLTLGMYLSLIFYFDNNFATHELLHEMKIFPEDYVKTINGGEYFISSGETRFSEQLEKEKGMIDKLDEKGIHTVKTVIKMEYDRCSKEKQ